MEQSTTTKHNCGAGPTGSSTPFAFAIFTGSWRTEKTKERQDGCRRQRDRTDHRGGMEDRKTGGGLGTPEYLPQSPADDSYNKLTR